MADNKSSELVVKVNVDISEALTGLKALQREAKETMKALRELENVQVEIDGRKIASTTITEIADELAYRSNRNGRF